MIFNESFRRTLKNTSYSYILSLCSFQKLRSVYTCYTADNANLKFGIVVLRRVVSEEGAEV